MKINIMMNNQLLYISYSLYRNNSRNAMLLNVPISYHPLIYLFRRKYSTDNNLQLQLSKDIRYVHDYLKAENLIPSITPFQLSIILQKIENSSYKVGPLEYFTCLDEDMNKLLKDILPDYPDIHIHVNKRNPERIFIIKASNIMDQIVLMGLSATLHRLIYGSLPQNGIRLMDRFPAFLQSLEDMNNVDMMYKVDMSASTSVITKALVLKAVKPFVGDNDYVFRLVSSLLELPIYTKDGDKVLVGSDDIPPPLGEVSRLLFNFVLMDLFDREFVKCFPEIRFRRFSHEVFVATADIYDVFFSEKSCYALLGKIGLRGEIYSISRGGGYLTCRCNIEKILFINNSSKVVISDPFPIWY